MIDYAEDWETHKKPIFESSFANDRGFTNDVDSAAGLTSSSSGSFMDDVINEGEHGSDSDEDADGNGMINGNEVHASSAHDPKHGAGNQIGDPDRDLWRSSLDSDNRVLTT